METVKSGYTAKFKEIAVQKYFHRGNRSLADLAAELGCSKSALWDWVQRYNKCAILVDMNTKEKRPKDWNPKEKIRAVFEYENLVGSQQGEFLRKNGLHSDNLAEWQKLCLNALSSKQGDNVSRCEFNEANRKIRELEKDLNRKDKALAETSALLILKKKADWIFGDEARK